MSDKLKCESMSPEDKEVVKKRGRGKGGISLDHSLLETSRPKRQRKLIQQQEDEDDYVTWNYNEKERLLDALYRHSHLAFESIAHAVKTKTPKQVEKFIEKTLNSSCLSYKRRVVELDPEKGAAPLELWLSLAQELVTTVKKVDHSNHYSKIMQLIGQNEPMPEDSGFMDLDWRKLYQFISDLLGDKAVLQPLTNMESLVLLDMMHSMGDTLHTSDTAQQRRLLDLKYQLFKWQIQHTKDPDFVASFSAINNDFSPADFSLKQPDGSTSSVSGKDFTSLLSASTSSSTQPQPSTSSEPPSTSQSSSNTRRLTPKSSSPTTSPAAATIDISSSQPGETVTLQPKSIRTMEATEENTPSNSHSDLPNNNNIRAAVVPSLLSFSPLNPDNSTTDTSAIISETDTSAIISETDDSAMITGSLSSPISSPKSSTAPKCSPSASERGMADCPNKSKTTTTSTSNPVTTNDNDPNTSTLPKPSTSTPSGIGNGNDKDEDTSDPLPNLFSLNPFTIPQSLFVLHPKKLSELDAPIIIGKKD